MLDRLTGFFFPVQSPGEEQRARAQLAIITLLGAITAALLGIAAYASAGRIGQSFPAALAVVSGTLTLATLRKSRSIELTSRVLGASFTFSYGLAALSAGDPSLLLWVALVPVVVLLLSNVKQALPWLAGCGLVIFLVSSFLLADTTRMHMAPPPVVLIRAVLFLTGLFALTVISSLSRERIQRSLELARDEANRANGLKSEFLANFSHEIRTPLNGVLGTAEVLLASELPPDVREQMLIIQRSGSSLLRTINDVLELSQIEAGRLDLFPVATDLPLLLGDVVELFKARALSKRLELRVVLEPGHPHHVTVDDLRLRQVVQNLVANAVKFTERGEVVVRLNGGPVSQGHVLTRISIEDTGPGIEPEAASRLFAAFTQARPLSDRVTGAGLGLAISSQFVELMEGKLTVETVLGQGSIFRVELTLPLAAQAHTSLPALVPELAVERLKLLVADDNEINLKVAVSLLGKLGHELVVARDGDQALRAIAEHQPDVVFMDCHMPVLDGLEATRRLRAAGDGRPVVALTASVYSEDRARCLDAGMNHFVSKPVTLLSLQNALREVSGGGPSLAKRLPSEKAPRALVVDDDPYVRLMTVRMLRAEGLEVSETGNLEEAALLFERISPAYLVVDRVLGGDEDGLHFAQRMSRSVKGLCVVVTSGRVPSRSELASLEAFGGRFLSKPYGRRGLMALFTPASPAQG